MARDATSPKIGTRSGIRKSAGEVALSFQRIHNSDKFTSAKTNNVATEVHSASRSNGITNAMRSTSPVTAAVATSGVDVRWWTRPNMRGRSPSPAIP